MKRRLALAVLGGALVAQALIVAPWADGVERRWKGAESLNPTSVGPNLSRCGPFPANLEARFTGTGTDTAGGVFVVTASGCLDTVAKRVFDLEATDTFVKTGDSLRIVPDDFSLVFDPQSCVSTNHVPVHFKVAGGTGVFAGATGEGTFDFAQNEPTCNPAGGSEPVRVWFSGHLRTS